MIVSYTDTSTNNSYNEENGKAQTESSNIYTGTLKVLINLQGGNHGASLWIKFIICQARVDHSGHYNKFRSPTSINSIL